MFDCPEYCKTSFPTSPDPVKATQSTSLWRHKDLPVIGPSPGKTENTHSGTPASDNRAPILIALIGDCSAGLSITEFPVIRAGAIFHIAIHKG